MAADYSRIHRLLKILTHIQGERGWTAKRLALECGTTERNIYRDLKSIEGAGVPYFFDTESNGYMIRRDFFMPAVELTFGESLALVALAEHVGGGEQVPFMNAAAKAIRKIRCNLPQKIQQELDKVDGQVAIHLSPVNPPEGTIDVYETMRAALGAKKSLSCEYESLAGNANGSAKPFMFKPYTLLFSQRAWYALGHHSRHKEVRCLKLNRFTRCQVTSDGYEVPKDFSVRKHLGNAWRMIRGPKSYDVELRFDQEFAETISDTHWHPTQDVESLEDGSMVFRCKVDGLDEIVWWVLSMGPHCVVNKPDELAKRVRELASGIVKHYAGG